MSPAGSPLRVVAIGGGTGLSALLHGLKRYANSPDRMEITAVVTVTDDGGSSGRLRRDFDVLPPGDIRNCMVALSQDEALLSKLFQYRFESGHGLKGHSFGNLFLTALTHITGDFAAAVKHSSEVMASMGRIFPATKVNVVLEAVLEDGTLVSGETKISKSRSRIAQVRLLPRRCKPLPETLEAIASADLITLGPGSLFTSVIPNLLVSGIAAAIRKSPAVKACYVNLMWQPGETNEFRASDHLRLIQQHARGKLIDYAVLNTGPIKPSLRKRYAREQAQPVENDVERIAEMKIEVVEANLVAGSERVRHDSAAIAEIALRLAREGRRRRQGESIE
ncbi:MAG: YvcK family protein [Acidobacteriota bacterium]|nr:YvcK family protein [Acidobacteriota bacterium]